MRLTGAGAIVVVGKSCWMMVVRPSTNLGVMPTPVAWGQAKPWAGWMLLHEKEMSSSYGGMPGWVPQPRPSSG